MYFVAPKSFQVVVRRDQTERFRDNDNNMQNIEKSPVVYAEFKRDEPIPSEYRILAVAHFNNPKRTRVGVDPSHPGRALATPFDYITAVGYVEGGQTADNKGHTAVYDGQTPENMVAVINTDNPGQVAPEDKAMVEAYLLNPDKGYGSRWIHFSSPVPTPWASYDNLQGEGVVKKITERITDDGLDPAYVLRYENVNKKRLAVVKALTELIAEQAEANATAIREA